MRRSLTPPKGAIRVGPGYHADAHRGIDATVALAERELDGVDFDTFVGTGISGSLAAPVLAHALGKNVVLVRRRGDRAHSSSPASGVLGRRWVFVDDLIDTGATHERVQRTIREVAADRNHATQQVGVFLYDASSDEPWHGYARGFAPVDTSDDEE